MFQRSLEYKGAEVALSLVVISSADNLLACWAQQYSVLKLCRVRAFNVAQGRVWIHYSQVTQVLQCHQVFTLSQAIQPSAAEGKSTKVFIDNVEQVFCSWKPEGKRRTRLRRGITSKRSLQTKARPMKNRVRFQGVLRLPSLGISFYINQVFCSRKKIHFLPAKRYPSKQI